MTLPSVLQSLRQNAGGILTAMDTGARDPQDQASRLQGCLTKILACIAGRATEAMQASQPAAISTSGGKLAALTKRFVLEIAHLSNELMRVASASTNASGSASERDLFTSP